MEREHDAQAEDRSAAADDLTMPPWRAGPFGSIVGDAGRADCDTRQQYGGDPLAEFVADRDRDLALCAWDLLIFVALLRGEGGSIGPTARALVDRCGVREEDIAMAARRKGQ